MKITLKMYYWSLLKYTYSEDFYFCIVTETFIAPYRLESNVWFANYKSIKHEKFSMQYSHHAVIN